MIPDLEQGRGASFDKVGGPTLSGAADADALPGMAVLSGTVQAPKPFTAAQVHLMNVDKNVLFMVYTSGGRYRAANLFPGTYEVTVRGKGLEGPSQKLTLAAGARETLNFSLRETAPYGLVLDRGENVWFAEFRRCKIGKFDPRTEKFTEYAALTQPCTIRRLGVDSAGMVWYGGFNTGKLGKIDPKTGKVVEYDLPMPHAEPYDVWPDRHDNIWISDGGQGGALIRFDPKTEKYTYYPTPQITDQPKLAITRDGAVWYTPRSSSKAAAGVLYPDVTTMKTLGAYY